MEREGQGGLVPGRVWGGRGRGDTFPIRPWGPGTMLKGVKGGIPARSDLGFGLVALKEYNRLTGTGNPNVCFSP